MSQPNSPPHRAERRNVKVIVELIEHTAAIAGSYDRGDLVSAVHETGIILTQEHVADGTAIHAHVPAILGSRLAPFLTA